MSAINILLLGGGAREHALAWKLRQSPRCGQLFVTPGNYGITKLAQSTGPITLTDFPSIAQLVRQEHIDLIVVGPEEPLVRGFRDYLEEQPDLAHVRLIGPGRSGARLEGSKDFSKAFMQRHGIPTAQARTFTAAQLDEALAYVTSHPLPVVLKADGLAAGKGVIIAQTADEARRGLEHLLGGAFGEASRTVLVEEFLEGIELSVFALTDGKTYKLLPEAKDYKRIGEGDTGPNTGGMGAVSPVPFADATFMQKVEERIIRPTVAGLAAENIPYLGFIFFGLINVGGDPFVIEYNARLGDPETQTILPRLENDLVELLLAAAEGRLADTTISIADNAAATVVLVAEGYPDEYKKEQIIEGLENEYEGVTVFHAATDTVDNHGPVITVGGRVLSLTGVAVNLPEALQRANAAALHITWEGMYYRKDIGFDVLAINL